jgi:hypothetical protein
MDVIKFLMEYNRMHQLYYGDCENCPRYEKGCSLLATNKQYLEKIVADVEQWSKEHPQKTRQQDFLEKYPNARLNEYGFPVICCSFLGYISDDDCKSDCKKCWELPLEEDE